MLQLPCNQIYITVNNNPKEIYLHDLEIDSLALKLGGSLIFPYLTLNRNDEEYRFFITSYTVTANESLAVINIEMTKDEEESLIKFIFD